MMNKQLFIETIEALQKQMEFDKECNKAFSTILPDCFITGYDNNLIIGKLIDILKEMTGDHKDSGLSWVEYFIYDLEFGKKYKKGCASYKDGSDIDLSTTEKLYEFLLKENDE